MSELSTDERLEQFRESTEATWNRGELDALDDVFSPDVVVHEVPTHETYEGLEAFKDWVRNIRTGFPDFELDADASTYFAGEDRIVGQWVFTGTHEGELSGIDADPTHQSVELAGVTVYALDGDEVTEAWWYFDMLSLLGQLGLVPGEIPA
jgi:steroid delta-isomerase-like uncharacterized protein